VNQPRDRDPAGRPRNARPRDELGRPLPRTAASDVSRIPDDLAITPEDAATLGASLLAEGRPFHAHEVFEAAWKSASGSERELWRGLAQIAVGLTHARRGNTSGAAALLRRGSGRVRGYRGDPLRYGVDAEFVAASADELATRIERDGLPSVPPADLLLALHPGG
jgi:predicted metal-dependent hydrolase